MTTKSLHYESLSDEIEVVNPLTKKEADRLFSFFKNHKLFNWDNANNDCEDRANAICMLLDHWKVSNAKSWVFSGYVFKKIGYLKNLWKYHVAAIVPVLDENKMQFYAIDPATSSRLELVSDWADHATDNPHGYYTIKNGDYYIFPASKIEKHKWFKRNKGNFNWTMQGLSGINGISSVGRAQLAFNKNKVKRTQKLFKELLHTGPPL